LKAEGEDEEKKLKLILFIDPEVLDIPVQETSKQIQQPRMF